MPLRLLQGSARVLCLALCLCISQAHAGSMPLLGVGAPASGGVPLFTFQAYASSPTISTNTATFSNVNVGTAASNRVIAVIPLYQNASIPNAITGVTIGGNAATNASGCSGNTVSTQSDCWYFALTSGTTATIVVTFTSSTGLTASSLVLGVAAIGTNTPTPGTAANSQQAFGSSASTTVTVPASGVAFTGIVLQNGNTSTFSNMTIDSSNVTTGPNASTVYFGHQTTTGADTATFGASDRASMATVPWGP